MNNEKDLHPYIWRPKKKIFADVEKEAAKQSLSVNGFITEAVKEKMNKKKKWGSIK